VQVQVQVQVQVRSSPSLGHATQLPYSDEKVANRNVRDFGWKRSITRTISVAPCQTLVLRIATFASLYAVRLSSLSLSSPRRACLGVNHTQ
jgi:hypothetical protein